MSSIREYYVGKEKTRKNRRYKAVVEVGSPGKRKHKTKSGFLRKKDAEDYIRKIENELDEFGTLINSKDTFEEFIWEWLEFYKKKVSISTYEKNMYIVKSQLTKNNPFQHKRIGNITTYDIDSFYEGKIDEGLSPTYIRDIHKTIRMSLNQAIKWQRIKTNPCENATLPRQKKEEVKVWSKEEIKKFLEAAENEPTFMFFLLAIQTGMRKSELIGLKWKDVDFKNRTIKIERSLTKTRTKGKLEKETKSMSSDRIISVSKNVIEKLSKYKEEQEEIKEEFGGHYNEEDYVLVSTIGTPLDHRNVLRVMERICKKNNIRKITIHDLRHTHASILIDSGVDIVKVSKRLGHANPSITLKVYSHLLPNEKDEIGDIFDESIDD